MSRFRAMVLRGSKRVGSRGILRRATAQFFETLEGRVLLSVAAPATAGTLLNEAGTSIQTVAPAQNGGTLLALGSTNPADGDAFPSGTPSPATTVTPTITWTNAAGGDWSVPGNWSGDRLPNSSDIVGISVGGTPTITFTTGSATVAGLTCDNQFTLSGGTLTVSGAVQVNNTFTLSGSGSLVSADVVAGSGGQGLTITGGSLNGVTIDGSATVTGAVTVTNGLTVNGTVTVGDPLSSTSGQMTFNGSQTLGGTGTVSFGNTSNSNGILAQTAATLLIIDSNLTVGGAGHGSLGYNPTTGGGASGASITNNGHITASGGGVLAIGCALGGESISVDATSSLIGGGTITSSTITTTAGAQIYNLTLSGVTVSGDWSVQSTHALTITNGLTLGGTLTLGDSTGNTSGVVNFSGSQAIGGTGSVVFAGSSTQSGLLLSTALTTLTIGANVVITGQHGFLGYNSTTGGGSSNSFIVNNGAIRDENGGGIIISTTVTNGGSITIDAVSALSGAGTIVGGTITTVAGAQIKGVTLSGVTVSGDWTVQQANSITVNNGLTLGGTLTLGESSSNTAGVINFAGSQSIAGAGAVVFAGSSTQSGLLLTTTLSTLTIGANVVITGQRGYLDINSSTGGGVSNSYVLNDGTIRDQNGGGIIISTTVTNSGSITIDATSAMTGTGTVVGGTITTVAGAQISNVTLSGVTVAGDWSVSGNTGVNVANGLTLGGTLTLGATNNVGGSVNFAGSQTLGGTGTVLFVGNSVLNGLLEASNGAALTIGSGIIVTGQHGDLGYDPNLGGANSVSVINNGTLQWSNGASFSTTAPITNNGTITVDATSSIVGNSTITGGTIYTTAGAQLYNLTLAGVTVNGDWTIIGNHTLNVSGGITLDGTLTLGESSGNTGGYLTFAGSQAVAGSATILLVGPSVLNGLNESVGGSALTIGPQITVRGDQGAIGYNPNIGGPTNVAVINNGTIQEQTAGRTLSINSQGGTLQNNGAINANAGTITITTGASGAASTGTISVSAGALLDGTGTIVGSTITTAAGAQINQLTLSGVTVNGDWTITGNNNVNAINGLTLNGTLTLGASNGTGGFVSFAGAQTVQGNGTVFFSNNSALNALQETVAAAALTIGPGVTVSGQHGFLGYDPSLGGAPNVTVINQGTILLAGGAAFQFDSPIVNQGAILVDASSTLSGNSTVTGGTMTGTAGAQISTLTLSAVTLAGAWNIQGNNSVTIVNGLTVSGTLALGATNGTGGYLAFPASDSINGTGSVYFASNSALNGLIETTTGDTLTIGSGLAVHGHSGDLGYDPSLGGATLTYMVNNGTIQADFSGGTINVYSQAGDLTNHGSLVASAGAVSVHASNLANTGSLTAGPNGGITVNGNLSLDSAGSVNVVLGGASAGLYGTLTVTGNAALDGTLNISEANSFTPGTGNNFTIMTSGSNAGQFASYTGLNLPGDVSLQPGYTSTHVTLTTVTTTTIAPDLRVTNLALSPPAPQSSQSVTVNWTDANAGNGATGASWVDHVQVVNTTTSQTIASADVPYSAATNGNLAAGASAAQSYTFTLPDGPNGAGNLQVTVTVDSTNNIAEFYPGNVGESNNSTTIIAVSTLAPYPDLQVSGLGVLPASPQSGQNITINWMDQNTGDAATSGNWNDGIVVMNTTTGQTLLNTSVQYVGATSGNIAAGASSPQLSHTFTLPNGSNGAGSLQITITTNVNGQLYEYNSSGTATSNDSATTSVASTVAAYPDLQISGLAVTPPSPQSGQNITIKWTDQNTGSAPTGGNWYDGITIVNTTTGHTVLNTSVQYLAATSGDIVAAGSSPQLAYTFALPNGADGAGSLQITVTANVNNQLFEYNGSGTALTNNTASTSISSTLVPYPDLQVSAVGTSANPRSGQNLTVNWTDQNTGSAPTSGNWYDGITVMNTTTGQTVLNTVVQYTAAASGDIAAGGSSPQLSYTFGLPDGANGAGSLQVTVTANIYNQLFEYNGSGTAQTNNSATTTVTSTLAAYPDLQVSGLGTSASPQSGGSLTVNWTDQNTGTAPTAGNWYDGITIVNTTTGQTLLATTLQYVAATSGKIAAGGSSPQLSFTTMLPNGAAGAGSLQVTVITNVNANLFEYNGSGTAQTNNAAATTVTSTLAPYPDLAPSAVTAPGSIIPNQPMTVSWTLTNSGPTDATGAWAEQVFLATDAAGDNPVFVGAVNDTAALAAGTSVGRSATFTAPALAPGNYWVVITENPYAQIFETNTANNSAVAASPSAIAQALTLTLAGHSVTTAAGPNATTAIVSRNGSTASALFVTITNPDGGLVTAPAGVTIAAGQSSVAFNVGVIDPGVVEGTQNVTLTAGAAGALSGSDTLTILDSLSPALSVSLSSNTISESDTNPAATATVTRNTSTAADLVVSLLSSDANKLQVPATVTIPAGQASATFDLTVVDDQELDGDAAATISASAAGFSGGSDTATVLDVNVPTLALALSDQTISEAGGIMATTGTVTLSAPATTTVVIGLTSSNTGAATVVTPQVIINAGGSSAMFVISAIDDGLDLGDKTTTISAQIITVQGTYLTNTSVSQTLTVVEHDGAALSIVLPVAAIAPNGTALATVTRNTSTTSPLTVTLSSSDTTHATVPASVTIPAGQSSTTFLITGVNDGLQDGEQYASITALAAGFDSAISRMGVTSVNLPDLVVTSVSEAPSANAGSTLQVSWTVENNGLYPGTGPWSDQIYLDPTDGGSGGGLLDTVTFSGTLTPGASYTQTDSVTLPAAAGQYNVRIVTDSASNLQELSFNNNALSQAITLVAPYTASVSSTLTGPVSNGTPITLSGNATLTSNGQPAAHVPVSVYVTSQGLVRTLSATTDSNGNYSATFQPLAMETGDYSIAAGYPGSPAGAAQGQFTIVGLGASPANGSVSVLLGTPVSGHITLTNLGLTSLSGLTAVAQGGPAGLNVQLNVASTLSGSGQTTLAYTFSAAGGGGTSGTVVLHITTAQGAVLDIPINVALIANTALLAVDPTYLYAGMLVGQQTLVSFQVTNNGGAASGDVQVLLPGAPYLSLASAATIPSLAPGASATVTLALTPAADLALAQYNGSIALNYGQTGLSIPYTFNAISSAVGDVQIIVDDVFTFDGSGSPRVADATVSLLDPYDNSHVIATGSSNGQGLATLPSVPAGTYVLQISAADHDTYRTSFTVLPGISNVAEAFLNVHLVTYTWVVTPTTISDQYTIKLQTTFQTNVPAPVVTITGPDSIPTLAPGQSGQMDVVVTNHGLIAAQDVSITLPTDPEYTFTTLTTTLGTVPAMSSVTVPIMVSRAPTAGGAVSNAALAAGAALTATPAADDSTSPCAIDISTTYFYDCAGIRHELIQSFSCDIGDRACNALGIVAQFLASLGGGGGTPLQIVIPPPEIWPLPPGGVTEPPGVPPRQLGIWDPPEEPPAVQSPSNCSPAAALAGALAAKALASPVTGPINGLFGGLELAGGLLSGNPSHNPLDYADPLFGAGEKAADAGLISAAAGEAMNVAGSLFGALTGALQTLGESNDPAPPLAYGSLGIRGIALPSADPGDGTGVATTDLSGSDLVAALSDVKTSALAIEDLLNPYVYFFASVDWVESPDSGTLGQWIGNFLADTNDTADGSINAADRASLLALTRPTGVTVNDANTFLDRWNRTIAYAGQGIFSTAQVPNGDSVDFIDRNELTTLLTQANASMLASQSGGYTDPDAQLHGALQQFIDTVNDNSVCATLKLEIDQTAMLTRSAFNGSLQVTNNEDSGPLSNIQLDLSITDANGNPVNGNFFISSPTFSGELSAVDGTGSIPIGGTGSVSYTFIPTDAAAPSSPTLYFIGGTFSYVDPDTGMEVVTPIYPSAITVYPQAKLQLDYFLQKDAIGDDPSTPQIEPSEPATLGVLVKNVGGGAANNMSITTAQPQIVENEKGLLANFTIVGTQVGTAAVTPSLTVDFGNIDPGQVGDATFQLVSSLQGQFQDFSATFTHSNALGGTETSLISSITTHELTHAGDFVFPGSTGETSYLVNDIPDPQSMPDAVYLSNGSSAPVALDTNVAVNGSISSLSGGVTVTANVVSGWSYLQLPDPGAGYVLYKVVRSDGVSIPVSDMAWTTDRDIAPTGKATVDYELHILDLNSTGSYTVYYRPANATAPAVTALQPISSPQSGAVNSVDVTFNEPIDPATFDWHNVTLTLNGGANLITSAVTISQNSTTSFTINNLAPLTASPGNYAMSVSAVGVSDFFADAGAGALSQTWATGTNVPVVVSVGSGNPALRNTPLQSVTVTLSEAIVPTSFDYHALTLTLNGGLNLITPAVTVTQVDPTTYAIGGLADLSGSDGTYVLTVNAGQLTDASGNTGVGALSEQWATSTAGPTIATLQQASQSPRSIIVPTLDVTFSEPIDPGTFTWQSITYSKTSGPNLIDGTITITQLSPTTFEVGNFNHLIAPIDGDYTFTVDASAVRDLYGNAGTGSASASWTLDTTAPTAPSGLAISPDTGVSSTDGETAANNITLTGTVFEPGLRVEVYDGLTTKLADAVVTGTTFSASLTLGAGSHALRVYAVDAAANISDSTTLNIYIDSTPLAASFAAVTQSSPQQAVASAQITFTKALSGSTLDYHSFTLTQNGGPNLIDSSVTIQQLSGNTYEIDGLAALSSTVGQYQLSLTPDNVQDQAGDTTLLPITTSWQVSAALQSAAFSNLSASRSIYFGIPTTVFSGHVAGASALPGTGETVAITVNGVTVQASINSQGNFAAAFATAALPVSATPYGVTYSFAGDPALTAVSDTTTTTLTVTRGIPTVLLSSPAGGFTYSGTSVGSGVGSNVAGLAGATAPTGAATIVYYIGSSATGTPLTSPPLNAGTYTAVGSYAGDADYVPAQSLPMTFTIARAPVTVTLPAAPTNLTYDGTNSVTAWVKAVVAGPSGAPAPSGPIIYTYYVGPSATGPGTTVAPIAANMYTVVASYGGNSNYLPNQSQAVTFTIAQPATPLSVAFKIDDGTAQRSMVRSLTVTFSSPVTLTAGAITLTDAGGSPIAFTLGTTDNTTYTLTFTGGAFIGGSLANGRYVLTVHAADVTGNGGTVLASDQALNFWRLFGDYYGTGSVNNADKTLFAQVYKNHSALYLAYFDFDGNGMLNATDLNAFNQDFGTFI